MERKKAIIIHGLNNHIGAFYELGKNFEDQFEIIYLKLPHHQEGPLDFSWERNIISFKKELYQHLEQTEFILAYSLGCSYLQYLWEKKELPFPLEKMIYLSPALKTKMRLQLLSFLPCHFPLPSFAPKEFRLRSFCYWGQYRMLYELTRALKLKVYPRIYADPLDELIDVSGLAYLPLHRQHLPYGRHHLTFHPKYYQGNQWKDLIDDFKDYLQLTV